jgi:hypothetical protein
LLVVLGAALIFLIYLLWKRKQERGYVFAPPPPPPPAHEVALKALRELYASNLLEKQEYKEFFSRLSEIIRAYLEGRYYIQALEQTTGEILRDLPDEVKQDDRLFEWLKDSLTVSDLVKFAKYIPSQEEIDRVKQEAVDFVEKTKIVFVQADADEEVNAGTNKAVEQ